MGEKLAIRNGAGLPALYFILLVTPCLCFEACLIPTDNTRLCAVSCQSIVLLLFNIAMQTVSCKTKFPLGGQ